MSNDELKRSGARKCGSKLKQTPKLADPCTECAERWKAAIGECNGGIGVCEEEMDYQRLLWERRNAEGV